VLSGWLAFVPITWYTDASDLLVLPATVAILWGLMQGQPLVNLVFGNRLAVFLGETSFALYMLHPFVKAVGDHVMRVHPKWSTPAHALPLLVLEVAAAYLIATVVYFIFERPARRGTLGLLRWAFPVPTALSAAGRPPLASK
jgi:peptidoglycan/LPS O-acetylase OafA/YrhL